MANSSSPIIYVFVPLKVIGLGLGAKIQIIFLAGAVMFTLAAYSDDNILPFPANLRLGLDAMFKCINSYMPKRLYFRAALILVFPVVFLQLIVSIVFIQRHF